MLLKISGQIVTLFKKIALLLTFNLAEGVDLPVPPSFRLK